MTPISDTFRRLVYGVVLNVFLFAAVAAWLARCTTALPGPHTRAPTDSAELFVVFGIVFAAGIVVVVTVGGSLGWASNRLAMLALTVALTLLPMIGRTWQTSWIAMGRLASALRDAARQIGAQVLAERLLRVALCCVAIPWLLLFVDRAFAPPVAWDALTYHLTFPLHWVQSGRLDTLVQPTGEPSSAFYPLVGEMQYYWGLLSTGTDAWNAFSQVPFLVLSAIAVASIARFTGATWALAALAALFWASIPVVLRQSIEPMVDLVSTCFFLCGVFLLLRWKAEGQSWRFVLGAAAIGMTIGTKYIGLVWWLGAVPLILLIGQRNAPRLKTRTLLTGVALGLVLGTYAYARNTWVGGNPFLPLEVKLAGHTLLHGSRTLGQYFASQLHNSALATLVSPKRALLDLGPALPLCVIMSVIALVLSARDPSRKTMAAVAATSILSIILFLITVPYREPRHLLAPVALAIAVIPATLSKRVVTFWNRPPTGLLPMINAPLGLLYWGKDLARAGPGFRHAVGAVAAIVVVAVLARVSFPGGRPILPRRRVHTALMGTTLLVLVVFSVARYESQRFVQWRAYWSARIPWGSSEPRPELVEAASMWTLLADRTRNRAVTIAYAGTNIPYPLAGFGLRNRVCFVPRNSGRESWHFDWSTPPPDPFSRPSYVSWLDNLRALDVHYLCVFREVRENDPLERFPIEAEWANASPAGFRRVLKGEWVQAYEVLPAPSDHVKAVVPVPLRLVFEDLDAVHGQEGYEHLVGRDPFVSQPDPRPASAPQLHRFVRQVEEEAPSRFQLPDPQPECVLPAVQVFQAMRAENIVE